MNWHRQPLPGRRPELLQHFQYAALGYTFNTTSKSFIANTTPQAKILADADKAPYKLEGPISVNQNDYVWPNFAPTT